MLQNEKHNSLKVSGLISDSFSRNTALAEALKNFSGIQRYEGGCDRYLGNQR